LHTLGRGRFTVSDHFKCIIELLQNIIRTTNIRTNEQNEKTGNDRTNERQQILRRQPRPPSRRSSISNTATLRCLHFQVCADRARSLARSQLAPRHRRDLARLRSVSAPLAAPLPTMVRTRSLSPLLPTPFPPLLAHYPAIGGASRSQSTPRVRGWFRRDLSHACDWNPCAPRSGAWGV
jgi:hypothetical protein